MHELLHLRFRQTFTFCQSSNGLSEQSSPWTSNASSWYSWSTWLPRSCQHKFATEPCRPAFLRISWLFKFYWNQYGHKLKCNKVLRIFLFISTLLNCWVYRTIVAFGDSWTSNGGRRFCPKPCMIWITVFSIIANGTVPVPPILWPPSPSAGSRLTENRRASNGFIWVEDLANSLSAKLLNVRGAPRP